MPVSSSKKRSKTAKKKTSRKKKLETECGGSKGPCPSPHCESSDGFHSYSDGHGHCYSCQHHVGSSGEASPLDDAPSGDLLPFDRIADLPKRKLRAEVCRKYGYGISGSRQVANYCDNLGRVVAQKIRRKGKKFAIAGDASKMRLFGQHLYRNGGRHLCISEGEIDTLTMAQVFGDMGKSYAFVGVPNGASAAASAVLAQLDWVESFDIVRICMDQDEPGRDAAEEIAALLAPGKAAIMVFEDGLDANDLVRQGRTKELVTAFWEAVPFRPDGLMTGKELWDSVIDEIVPASIPYPYEELNCRTDGMRSGEIITIAAGPAAGKTTFCAELANYLIGEGQKVGYISLEQGRRGTLLSLLTPRVDIPLHREHGVDLNDHQEAWEAIEDSLIVYRHAGRLDAESLGEKARFMAKGDGCQFIFVDNLSIVVSSSDGSGGGTALIDEIMNSLVSLVRETEVTIFLVVHLKRPGKGLGYSEGRTVRMEDMRGSGMIEAFSHDVFSLERDQEKGTPTQIRLLKCRQTGEAGPAGWLSYSSETGRLIACAEPDQFEDDEGYDSTNKGDY